MERHTGKNMANLLGCALDQYWLHSKVGWFTSDGAAVNCTTLHILQNSASVKPGWMAQQHDMLYVFPFLVFPNLTLKPRCMEHLLHLVAQHFIQSIMPHFSTRGAASRANSEGNAASDNNDDNSNDGNSDKNNKSVNNGDLLRKVIAFVKQVRISMYY
jgi:hypothetical protein